MAPERQQITEDRSLDSALFCSLENTGANL
jgi:hypothetical protein